MLECATIPFPVLNDRRLSRGDIREYGLLSAGSNGEENSFRGMERSKRRRIRKLVRLGYVGIERDSNGTRCKLIQIREIQQRRETTIMDFAKEHEVYARTVHTAKTVQTYQTALREFTRIIGNVSLASIGIREIEKFFAVKKTEASAFTARKYYISLASAFEKAVLWGYISENPFRRVAKPKVHEVIPAYFTEPEFRLFLSAVKDRDFAELCKTGILTGLRLGELLNLRWGDLDFQLGKILVQNHDDFIPKSKRPRGLPISDELSRILAERKKNIRSESEFIFPNRHGRKLNVGLVERKFKKAVRLAGLSERLHFHSLRHSYASGLVSSGVSLYAVGKLLGHAHATTTEIYAHLAPDGLHSEVNKLDRLFDLTGGSP